MHILIKNKYLIYDNYKVKCALGKRGIGLKRREGDLITPKGTFKIKQIFYRYDRIKKLETSIKKYKINKKMGWCNDTNSKYYNKLVKYPFSFKSENLYRKDNIYDIILVLNYYMSPTKKKKGSAIFLHVSKNNYSDTEGCVAIRKKDLRKLLKKITKTTKVKII